MESTTVSGRMNQAVASLEMVACDTLKVRATSAWASPLVRRWRASAR
jgi:hypothetical protein